MLSLALSPSGTSLAVGIGGQQGAILLYTIAAAAATGTSGAEQTDGRNGWALRVCQQRCGAMVWIAWVNEGLLITAAAAKALMLWHAPVQSTESAATGRILP